MKLIPFLLALGLAVGGVFVPAAPTPVNDGGVTIVAAPAFSGVLRQGQSLQISGTVTNSAGQAMDAGTATVYLSGSALTTRSDLSRWLSADDSTSGESLGSTVGSLAIGELAAGQVRTFAITVPLSAMNLPATDRSVFPLAVRLAAGAVVLDTSRSVVVLTSEVVSSQVNLAVALPLAAPPSSTGLLDGPTLATLTSPGGLLDRQLNTAMVHRVAIGIDPMIAASIRLLGASAPPSATNWLNRLETATNDIFSLAYADADPVLEHQAGAHSVLAPLTFPVDTSLFPPQPTATPQPTDTAAPRDTGTPTPAQLVAMPDTIDGLAWPAVEDVTEKDLNFIAGGGFARTIVTSSALSAYSLASPNAMIGGHSVTVSDAQVSDLLRVAANATSEGEWAHATASLAGVLAVTATQHPGATLFATLGRDNPASLRLLGTTLTAVEALPWVTPISLSEALAVPSTKQTLGDSHENLERVPLAMRLLNAEGQTSRFSTVAHDPTLITGPQRLALLALLSASWISDTASWETGAQAYLKANDALRSSVYIPESSQINLLQEKGNLYIAVRNELDFPITVYLTVQPERAILDVLDTHVELKIEANSQAKASIPVQSIANGEVRTRVTLTSASGEAISTPTFIVLNVQAGWETAAAVVLAILVVAIFGAGIWRTVLRRRKTLAKRREQGLAKS
ncbi:MAG: DUF6049 family protein [Terrimesophilobacter sp.]